MEDTPKAVHSEAYILVPHTVEDLDDFVENPDKYLVDMYEAPERAADIWRNRLKRNPYGGEGLLQVAYYGIDLISASLWDNVASLWMDLVEVIDSFLQTGEGEGLFPGSPVPIHLRSKGRSTLFTVDEQTNVVDPKDFIPGMLDEAQRYFKWIQENIGTDESGDLGAINEVRDLFVEWSARH